MAKTIAELTQLKEEYNTLNNKLKELSDDELRHVTGGKRGSSYLASNEQGTGGSGLGSHGEVQQQCHPGIGSYGGGKTFTVCRDKPNQGLKPECAECAARSSTH